MKSMLPFMTSQYVSELNLDALQNLMYRPTYWWDGSPYQLNAAKSLAEKPVFKDGDREVVIKMKSGWHFSNGETMPNLAFFLNMLPPEHRQSFGGISRAPSRIRRANGGL